MPTYAIISRDYMFQLTLTVREEHFEEENSFFFLVPPVAADWRPSDGIQPSQLCQCKLGLGRYQQWLARVGMLTDEVSQQSQTKQKLGCLCGHSAHAYTHCTDFIPHNCAETLHSMQDNTINR